MENITITEFFFWLTGIAVIIITVLIAVALLYIIWVLRTIKSAAQTAKRTAEFVTDDLGELRKNIKEQGFSIKPLIKFALGLRSKGKKK